MVTTRSSRKRQTRLTFEPSSSSQASQLSEDVRHRAAAVSFQGAAPKKRRITDDAGKSNSLPSTKTPKKQTARQGGCKLVEVLTPPPTSRTLEAIATNSREASLSAGRANVDLSDDSEDSDNLPLIPSSGRLTRRKAVLVSDDDEVLSDDSTVADKTARENSKRNHVEDEGDKGKEGHPLPSSGRSTRHRLIVVSDVEDDLETNFTMNNKTPSGTITGNHEENEDEGDEDEDDIKTPVSRRALRRRSAPNQATESDPDESKELADDVDDLESNVLQETRTRQNFGSGRRASQRDRLQLLKARREARKRGENAGLPDLQESYPVEQDTRNPFVEDIDDEGFLTDDDSLDDDAENVKTIMPMFSNFSAEEAFELVVEWLVHKKLNPKFDANAENYGLALRKLDDQASTFASSKFSSSAWKPEFYRALDARPHLIEKCTGILLDSCQACGRSSHPATWRVQFTGPVYHRNTLERIDDEDEEAQDYDVDGVEIVSQDYQFSIGNDCRNNAAYAHSLKHWRYNLNVQVLDYLADEGYFEADQSATREAWSDQGYATFAETVVEAMKADQSMDQMWTVFKDTIEQAEGPKMRGSGRQFSSE